MIEQILIYKTLFFNTVTTISSASFSPKINKFLPCLSNKSYHYFGAALLRGVLRELGLLGPVQGSHHGHKSLQEVQRDRAGLWAQPGAQELPISSTAVLGSVRAPAQGAESGGGSSWWDLLQPLGTLLWVVLLGLGGTRGTQRCLQPQPCHNSAHTF